MKLLGAAFEKSRPGVRVQLFPSLGSSGGIMALSKGALDIALSSRPLSTDERQAGLATMEYARTPFVFIAHRNVGKDTMTIRELEDVYAGKTQYWPDHRRIRLVLRPETDTTSKILRSISPGTDRGLSIARSGNSYVLAITDQDSTHTVANLIGAFGTSTLAQLMTEKPPVKSLAFQGVTPGVRSLSDGSYPLFTTLYIITSPSLHPAARQFVRFIFSGEGRKILASNGNLVTGARHDK